MTKDDEIRRSIEKLEEENRQTKESLEYGQRLARALAEKERLTKAKAKAQKKGLHNRPRKTWQFWSIWAIVAVVFIVTCLGAAMCYFLYQFVYYIYAPYQQAFDELGSL